MQDTDQQEGFALPAPSAPPVVVETPTPLTNTAIVIKIMALLDQIK